MKKQLSRDEVVALMKRQQGNRSKLEYAAQLGISSVYLGDIYVGKKDPGPSVLSALGLKRLFVYERVA